MSGSCDTGSVYAALLIGSRGPGFFFPMSPWAGRPTSRVLASAQATSARFS